MKTIIFISIIGTIFFYNCFSDAQGVDGVSDQNKIMDTNKIEYSKVIQTIDAKVQNTGTWEALFAEKDFINLYEKSHTYIDSAIRFISSQEYTDHQKSVCVLSLQNANLNDYNRFFSKCKDLFNNEAISENIIKKVISPNFGKKEPVIQNYRNNITRKILIAIRDGRKASETLKTMINKIYSGEYLKNIQKLKH